MDEMEKLQEARERAAEQLADSYLNPKHRLNKYMKDFEQSPYAKVKTLEAIDYAQLGKTLEREESYLEWCQSMKLFEADGTVASLGTYPNVALDALTVLFGASPINMIASVQPIDEVQGIVYFRDFQAQNTRGNVSAGQNLLSSLAAPDVFPIGYASDTVKNANFISDSSPSAPQTYTSAALDGSNDFGSPINPQTIVLSGTIVASGGTASFANIVPDPTSGAFSQVQGAGGSQKVSLYGVVNYANGTVTMTVIVDGGSLTSVNMFANFQTIEEGNTDLQKAILVLQTKPVQARFFALKSTIGLAESYMLNKRFGIVAAEEIARDLTVAINNEIVNTAIQLIGANIPSANQTVSWTRQPQNGVGYFEHQLTILNAMTDADAQIVKSAGRGAVNCWIVGRQAGAILSRIPGFRKVFDDMSFGPHIYGEIEGVPVVRVPYSQILDDNTMYGICKGKGAFEAPIVYAPYMPLTVTNVLPMAYNPLQQQRACAVWSALDPLVSSLSTQMTISETDFNYGANS